MSNARDAHEFGDESFLADGSKRIDAKIKVLSDPHLHRAQKLHFILYDILPAIGTAAALWLLTVEPLKASDIIVFVLMWFATGLGISVGYHRLFTHRSFKTVTTVRVILAICGAMAGQGGLISWTAMHRRHHECGDREGDMHSPNLSGPGLRGRIRGFLHAHLTWMAKHDYPNVAHYAPDLLRDRAMVRVNRHYQTWVLVGLVIPAVVGGVISQTWIGCLSGFLWGGPVRMFVVAQLIWSLNSVCHMFGAREFDTPDESRNVAWLTPFFLGEAWHHNHHAFPGSASFGLYWYRIDPGFWIIKTLERFRLAWDVRVADEGQLEKKRLPADPRTGSIR